MSNSEKSATLDYVDTGPDVYEYVPEEPDYNRSLLPDEASNDSIDRSELKPGSALEKFRQHDVEKPYQEYELVPKGRPQHEVLAERLLRQERELEESKTALAKLKETNGCNADNYETMSIRIGKLQSALIGLKTDEVWSMSPAIGQHVGANVEQLTQRMEVLKKSSQEPGPSEVGIYVCSGSDGGGRSADSDRLVALEKRLKALEDLVGPDPQQWGALSSELGGRGLLDGVTTLSSQITLLDPKNLEQIEGRLQSVNLQLTQIADKKKLALDQQKESKVAELYNIVQKWASIADSVPRVHARLEALKELHMRALQFAQKLSQLDSAMTQLESAVDASSSTMRALNEQTAANLSTLHNSCQALNQRLDNVERRLSSLK